MATRTTLILGPDVRRAARQLAVHYECSASEAIRKAVLRQRDLVTGKSQKSTYQRKELLRTLFNLFENNDPNEEIKNLKAQDEWSF